MTDHTTRLDEAVRAAVPGVVSVSVGTPGDPATVGVSPPELQAAAQPVIDAFDWSPQAHAAWLDDRKPERRDLRAAAANALDANAAFLALASPTNAQIAAQVRRLTQQMNAVIRRLIQLD